MMNSSTFKPYIEVGPMLAPFHFFDVSYAVAQRGFSCGTAWLLTWHGVPVQMAARAISKIQPHKTRRFFIRCTYRLQLVFSPLFIRVKQQLRDVCPFNRIEDPISQGRDPKGLLFRAFRLVSDWAAAGRWIAGVLGIAVALGASISLPSHAEGWGPLGGSEWVSVTAFDERGAPSSLKPKTASWTLPDAPELAQLHAVISLAESHQDQYDAYHHSARVPPPKKPSLLTLAEIQKWIRTTPKQHHAIGRYQIIPSTLERLIRKTGVPRTTVFSKQVQDMFANVLIDEAGYQKFRSGQISRDRFMDELAKIWAGFPSSNGRSAYHGKAGNRATISREFFAMQMAKIFGQKA